LKQTKVDFKLIITLLIWGLIGALCALVLTFIFNATGLTQIGSFQEAENALFGISSSVPVLIVLYCFFTPLVEELIFRYLLYNFIMRYVKRAAAGIILTAALFGIYHLNPVQMLYGFLMGLIITYSYYRHHILTIPFVVHACANAVALAITLI
jgi:membrane protease YdiL (CAAX protease family)